MPRRVSYTSPKLRREVWAGEAEFEVITTPTVLKAGAQRSSPRTCLRDKVGPGLSPRAPHFQNCHRQRRSSEVQRSKKMVSRSQHRILSAQISLCTQKS